MSALFYPTLTETMIADAGIIPGEYVFDFKLQDNYEALQSTGKSKIRLEQPGGDWRIERDGLRIRKTVRIETPKILFGKQGVAPRLSKLGMYIIWNNAGLTQMGVIKPIVDKTRKRFTFCHEFLPGQISGSLELKLNLYIDEPAQTIQSDEQGLMNETGVSLGQIEVVQLNLSNEFMDFPTREITDPSLPLWWLELKDWEDPTQDSFDRNHVQLYVNTAHKASKVLLDDKKGINLLVEIVSTSILLIVQKINEHELLQKTIDNVDLVPGSISSFIYKFYLDCDPKFNANQSAEEMLKVIHDNIDKLLRGKGASE